ncbi:uncharacterized protein LOC144871147 [Branchiostoma floridae x Branchiostoma japonicum]
MMASHWLFAVALVVCLSHRSVYSRTLQDETADTSRQGTNVAEYYRQEGNNGRCTYTFVVPTEDAPCAKSAQDHSTAILEIKDDMGKMKALWSDLNSRLAALEQQNTVVTRAPEQIMDQSANMESRLQESEHKIQHLMTLMINHTHDIKVLQDSYRQVDNNAIVLSRVMAEIMEQNRGLQAGLRDDRGAVKKLQYTVSNQTETTNQLRALVVRQNEVINELSKQILENRENSRDLERQLGWLKHAQAEGTADDREGMKNLTDIIFNLQNDIIREQASIRVQLRTVLRKQKRSGKKFDETIRDLTQVIVGVQKEVNKASPKEANDASSTVTLYQRAGAMVAHDKRPMSAGTGQNDPAKRIPMLVMDLPKGGRAEAVKLANDCAEIYRGAHRKDGVYTIGIGHDVMSVFCDMTTSRGGWTVFQRRQDGTVDFNRNWAQYKHGFGTAGGEYWLGNENLHLLTRGGKYMLRIDFEDWEGVKRFAEYDSFKLEPEVDKYRLRLGNYDGTAGDALIHDKNDQFSTYDQDHDSSQNNCAQLKSGGWWYSDCSRSNINGRYYKTGMYHSTYQNGIYWHDFRGVWYSLKSVQMAIRPVDYRQ